MARDIHGVAVYTWCIGSNILGGMSDISSRGVGSWCWYQYHGYRKYFEIYDASIGRAGLSCSFSIEISQIQCQIYTYLIYTYLRNWLQLRINFQSHRIKRNISFILPNVIYIFNWNILNFFNYIYIIINSLIIYVHLNLEVVYRFSLFKKLTY